MLSCSSSSLSFSILSYSYISLSSSSFKCFWRILFISTGPVHASNSYTFLISYSICSYSLFNASYYLLSIFSYYFYSFVFISISTLFCISDSSLSFCSWIFCLSLIETTSVLTEQNFLAELNTARNPFTKALRMSRRIILVFLPIR